MRRLIRPTGFVDSPFGHDGKVARLAGGLNWFASVELLTVEDGKRTTAELLPAEGLESRFDDILAAQWKALTGVAPTNVVLPFWIDKGTNMGAEFPPRISTSSAAP